MKEMGLSYLDDSSHEFVTGECRCDLDGLGKVIIDTLVSGLARLDDVLCGVLVTTFETILDAGLVALPVGQIKRLGTFIRAAKTVTENGLDAGVFFGSWANPICGKGWDKPSEDHVFAELAQAPDEYGSSLGCKRMEGCPESHNQRRGLDKDVRGLFGKIGGRKGGGKPGPGKPGGSNDKDKPKPADKPTDEPKSDDKPKSTTKDEPKSTTKDNPTTTEEKPKQATANKPNSTTRDKSTTKTNDGPTTTSRPKSATSTHSKPASDSETRRPSPTTSHSRSTSKDGNTGVSSTIKPGPTTTDRPAVSSTSSHKASSKHSSTQTSSTTTQGQPTTSPICKPGKGVGGCSACSNVQAWPPGYFKEDGRGEDDDDEAAHLAIRGTGFFGWESPSLERRAKKSTTSTSTPSSTSGSLTATSSTSTQTGIPTPPVLKPSKKGKKVQFCSMMTQTALYPGPAKLIGHKNVRVNATYALKDPRECGDFNILRRPNPRYKLDYKSLNSPKHDANYGLATEHVLETQLINLFSAAISKQEGEIFENPYDSNSAKMVDFCTYMKAYWDDNDKNTLPNIGGTSRLAIQWIADQFPTTKFQANEFFLLPGAPNGVKGRAWGGDSIYTADTKASLKNKDFLTNSKLQESELVKAIIRFKDVMFAYKYMAMNDVQSVLKEQAHRISNALGELDIATEAVDFEKLTKTIIRNYVYRDLQKKWDKWIKEHTKDTIEKVEKFFDEQYGHYTKARAELEKDLKAAIEAAEKEEKDDKSKKLNQTAADAKKAKHKAEKERYETVIQYLVDLEKAYTDMKKKPWTNPF
ncbi:hypothetical protein TMEN_6158 [Trichophyton mentagrophytes]|nr:hypothetical protein TMEN_6158 [Trichophyton mentagrophytes]